MTRYIAKRTLTSLATLFFVIVLTFLLMHSVPGGPFSQEKQAPPEVTAALSHK